MSSEKAIVNFWYEQQGYFTVSSLKSRNRDIGIIALKFSKEKVVDSAYVDVSCSLTGNVESWHSDAAINAIVREKFGNVAVRGALEKRLESMPISGKELRNVLVLGAIPKSRRQEMAQKFKESGVEIVEFEHVLGEVMKSLDTQYYKDDVIRTLQLVKFLLMSEPKRLSEIMGSDVLNASLRQELLTLMMGDSKMMKGFRAADGDKVAEIINISGMRNPEKLASMLQQKVLNSRTRKPFVEEMMKQKGVKRMMKAKKETPLRKFF